MRDPAATVEPTGAPAGSAWATAGVYQCRYAGAMLLYPYLHRVGAEAILSTLTGGPGRRYGDLAVLTTATLGFALRVDTIEGTKHLRPADAGALHRAFTAGVLRCDPAPEAVYFVDDHFVAYSGARPVAKGWNTNTAMPCRARARRHTGARRPGPGGGLRQR